VALLTRRDAATLLGVSERSLGRHREHLAELGLAKLVGSRWLYESEGLASAWLGLAELQVSNAEQLERLQGAGGDGQRLEAEAQQQVEADAVAGKIPSYAESRARKEHYLALLAQRQLERLEGTLISAEAVKAMFFEEFRRTRDYLQNFPARISATLFAQKDSAHVAIVLEKEIHSALMDLSNGVEYKISRLEEAADG